VDYLPGTGALGPVGYTPGEPVHAEVVAYFADEPARLYQLRQWLPVLERLDGRHRMLVLTRDARTYGRGSRHDGAALRSGSRRTRCGRPLRRLRL